MSTTKREARLVEVAELAGVSAMTVSRVLNDKAGVSAPTHQRVLAAAAALDYRPNRTARALRSGATDRITVMVRSHPQLDFRMVSAFGHLARESGRAVEVVITAVPSGGAMPGSVADGTVVVDVDLEEAATAVWGSSGRPVVVVTAESALTTVVPTVSTQDDDAARLAVAHLIALGHRRIDHVAGPRRTGRSVARQRGWSRALGEAGLGRGRLARGDWTAASGERAAATLMAHPDPPTAVFVADDCMAIGVLKHLHRQGLRVPQDVSVMGFGDHAGSDSLIPGLSTVRTDFDGVAREAFRLLDGGIDGPPRSLPLLLARESAGPPRRETQARRRPSVRPETPSST